MEHEKTVRQPMKRMAVSLLSSGVFFRLAIVLAILAVLWGVLGMILL